MTATQRDALVQEEVRQCWLHLNHGWRCLLFWRRVFPLLLILSGSLTEMPTGMFPGWFWGHSIWQPRLAITIGVIIRFNCQLGKICNYLGNGLLVGPMGDHWVMLSDVGRLIWIVGGTVLWAGNPRLCEMERASWTLSYLCLFFLFVDMMWPAASNSCRHGFPALMVHTLNSELK